MAGSRYNAIYKRKLEAHSARRLGRSNRVFANKKTVESPSRITPVGTSSLHVSHSMVYRTECNAKVRRIQYSHSILVEIQQLMLLGKAWKISLRIPPHTLRHTSLGDADVAGRTAEGLDWGARVDTRALSILVLEREFLSPGGAANVRVRRDAVQPISCVDLLHSIVRVCIGVG